MPFNRGANIPTVSEFNQLVADFGQTDDFKNLPEETQKEIADIADEIYKNLYKRETITAKQKQNIGSLSEAEADVLKSGGYGGALSDLDAKGQVGLIDRIGLGAINTAGAVGRGVTEMAGLMPRLSGFLARTAGFEERGKEVSKVGKDIAESGARVVPSAYQGADVDAVGVAGRGVEGVGEMLPSLLLFGGAGAAGRTVGAAAAARGLPMIAKAAPVASQIAAMTATSLPNISDLIEESTGEFKPGTAFAVAGGTGALTVAAFGIMLNRGVKPDAAAAKIVDMARKGTLSQILTVGKDGIAQGLKSGAAFAGTGTLSNLLLQAGVKPDELPSLTEALKAGVQSAPTGFLMGAASGVMNSAGAANVVREYGRATILDANVKSKILRALEGKEKSDLAGIMAALKKAETEVKSDYERGLIKNFMSDVKSKFDAGIYTRQRESAYQRLETSFSPTPQQPTPQTPPPQPRLSGDTPQLEQPGYITRAQRQAAMPRPPAVIPAGMSIAAQDQILNEAVALPEKRAKLSGLSERLVKGKMNMEVAAKKAAEVKTLEEAKEIDYNRASTILSYALNPADEQSKQEAIAAFKEYPRDLQDMVLADYERERPGIGKVLELVPETWKEKKAKYKAELLQQKQAKTAERKARRAEAMQMANESARSQPVPVETSRLEPGKVPVQIVDKSGQVPTEKRMRISSPGDASRIEKRLTQNVNKNLTQEKPYVKSEAESNISEEELARLGLVRKFGDYWQYRFDIGGKWYYANDKGGAIEQAKKTYLKTPKEQRLTPKELGELADKKRLATISERYKNLSASELKSRLNEIDIKIKSLRKAGTREFTGAGTRRTGAAVSNEAARELAQERLDIEFLLNQPTVKQPEPAAAQKPAEPVKQPSSKYTVEPFQGGFRVLDPEGKQYSWHTSKDEAENKAGSLNSGKTEPVKAAPIEARPTTQPTTGMKITAENAELLGNAQKLRASAASLMAKAQEDLNRDRLSNTGRRARMAASATDDALNREAFAKTMNNLADAMERGEVKYLKNVNSRAGLELFKRHLDKARYKYGQKNDISWDKQRDIEMTDSIIRESAEFDRPRPYGNWFADAAKELETIPGMKPAAAYVEKLGRGYRDRNVPLGEEAVNKLVEIKTNLAKKKVKAPYQFSRILETVEEYLKLRKAGIKTDYDLADALIEYRDLAASKKKESPLVKAERELVGRKFEGFDFFPTPPALAERIASELDIQPGMKILEPSAGKGDLADAVKKVQPDAEVSAIEPLADLRDILKFKNHEVIDTDFESFETDQKFDRIIMNPPFSKNRDIKHVRKAYDLLAPGGKLAAITSNHFTFANDKESIAFREWLDEVGGKTESLGQAFAGKDAFRQTGVNSQLVTIEKPSEAKTSAEQELERQEAADLKRIAENKARREAEEAEKKRLENMSKAELDAAYNAATTKSEQDKYLKALMNATAKEQKAQMQEALKTLYKGDDIIFQFPDGRDVGAEIIDPTPKTIDGVPDQIYVKMENNALRFIPKAWVKKLTGLKSIERRRAENQKTEVTTEQIRQKISELKKPKAPTTKPIQFKPSEYPVGETMLTEDEWKAKNKALAEGRIFGKIQDLEKFLKEFSQKNKQLKFKIADVHVNTTIKRKVYERQIEVYRNGKKQGHVSFDWNRFEFVDGKNAANVAFNLNQDLANFKTEIMDMTAPNRSPLLPSNVRMTMPSSPWGKKPSKAGPLENLQQLSDGFTIDNKLVVNDAAPSGRGKVIKRENNGFTRIVSDFAIDINEKPKFKLPLLGGNIQSGKVYFVTDGKEAANLIDGPEIFAVMPISEGRIEANEYYFDYDFIKQIQSIYGDVSFVALKPRTADPSSIVGQFATPTGKTVVLMPMDRVPERVRARKATGKPLFTVEYLAAKYLAKGIKNIGKVIRAGVNFLRAGAKTFAQWARKMSARFGKGVHSYLREMFKALQDFNRSLGRTGGIGERKKSLKTIIHEQTGFKKPEEVKTLSDAAALKRGLSREATATKKAFLAGIKDTKARTTKALNGKFANIEDSRNLLKDLAIKSLLPSDRSAVMQAIVNAKTPAQFTTIADRILETAERRYRKDELERFRKLYGSTKKLHTALIKDREKLLGGLTENEIQELLTSNDFTDSSLRKLRDAATNIKSALKQFGQTDLNVPEFLLDGFRQIKDDFGPVELNTINDGLEYINLVQGLINKATIKGQIMDASEAASQIVKELPKEKLPQTRETTKAGFVRSYLKPVTAINSMDGYNLAASMGSSGHDVFYEQLNKGQDRSFKMLSDGYKFKDQLEESLGGDKWREHLAKPSFEITASDGKKFQLNNGERLYVIALAEDPQTAELIDSSGFVFGDKADSAPFKISLSQIDDMRDNLTASERLYINELRRYINFDILEKTNKTSQGLEGYILVEGNPQYFPRARQMKERAFLGDKKVDMLDGYQDMITTAEHMPFLKSRVQTGNIPFKVRSIDKVFDRHLNEAALYNGMAEPLRNISRIMNMPGFERNVTETFGIEFTERLKQRSALIAMQARHDTSVDKILMKLLRQAAPAKLTPRSFLKQFSSVPAASTIIPREYLLDAFFSPSTFGNKTRERMIENSPLAFLRYRNNAAGVFVPGVFTWEDQSKVMRGLKGFQQTMLSIPARFDRYSLQAIFRAAELWAKEEGKPLEWAVEKFEKAVKETQNTMDVVHATGWQEQARQNIGPAIVGMFKAQPMKNTQNILRSWRSWKSGKKSFADFVADYVSVILGNAAINTAVMITIGSLLGKSYSLKDSGNQLLDELIDTVVTNPLGNTLVGAKDIKSALQGEKTFEKEFLLLGDITLITNGLLKVLTDAAKDNEDGKKIDPTLVKFFKAIKSKEFKAALQVFGAPTWPMDFIQSYFKNKDKAKEAVEKAAKAEAKKLKAINRRDNIKRPRRPSRPRR